MPTPEVSLRCHNCGYDNEHQRVYCHNCGTKLDRSSLPKELTAKKTTAKIEQHIRKLTNPRRGRFGLVLRTMAKSLGTALLLAFLIVIFLHPVDEPAPLNIKDLAASPYIYDDLTAAAGLPVARRLSYSETGANGYLQAAYRSRDVEVFLIPFRFERAYTKFNEGNVQITAQMSLFGLQFFTGGTYALSLRSGKLERQCLGGHMGRLQIPGALMQFLDAGLEPLWKLLDRDKRVIMQLQSVTFRQGVVEFQTRG